MASFNELTAFGRESAHGAPIYRVALLGSWDKLTPDETAVARLTLLSSTRFFEQAFLQHRAGFLSDDVWAGRLHQLTMSLGWPGFAPGWEAIRPMVNSDFAALCDGLANTGAEVLEAHGAAWGRVGFDLAPAAPDARMDTS